MHFDESLIVLHVLFEFEHTFTVIHAYDKLIDVLRIAIYTRAIAYIVNWERVLVKMFW